MDEASRNYLFCSKGVSLRSLCYTYPASMCYIQKCVSLKEVSVFWFWNLLLAKLDSRAPWLLSQALQWEKQKLQARFGYFHPTHKKQTVSMLLSYCQCLVLICVGEAKRRRGLSLELQGSVFIVFIYLAFNWNTCLVGLEQCWIRTWIVRLGKNWESGGKSVLSEVKSRGLVYQ